MPRVLSLLTVGLTAVVLTCVGATAAGAAVLLTPAQAEERLMPPHDTVRKVIWRPSEGEAHRFQAWLGYAPPRRRYIWRVAEQAGQPVGYLLVDNEFGKHAPITFAVALDADGAVHGVAVCVYRESRGDEVKRRSFMSQFTGRRPGDRVRLGRDIVHVSGATISSRSAVATVNRALVLWALAFAPEQMPGAGAAE